MDDKFQIIKEPLTNNEDTLESVTKKDDSDKLKQINGSNKIPLTEDDINKLFFEQKWRMIRTIGGSNSIPNVLKTYN